MGNENLQLSAPPMEEGLGHGRLWKPCRSLAWEDRICSWISLPYPEDTGLGKPQFCPGRRAMTVW